MDSLMLGTYEAGESGNKAYVPLLLKDAADPSCCTDMRFKGFSIYTEKMYALERIFKVKAPRAYGGILSKPNSINIKFYNDLWQKMNKSK